MEEEVNLQKNNPNNIKTSNNSKKIAAFVVVTMILLIILLNFVISSYVQSIQRKMITTTILSLANNQKSESINEKITNINEAREIIAKSKEINLNKFNDVKKYGEIEEQIRDYYEICEDGTNITAKEIINGKKCIGSSYSIRSTSNFITIKNNKSLDIVTVMLTSALITSISETSIEYINYLNNSKQTTTSSLLLLNNIGQYTRVWATLLPHVQNRYNNITEELVIVSPTYNYTIEKRTPLEKDLKEEIIFFEKFANEMKYPSEDEIKNLKIKDRCINSLKNLDKNQMIIINNIFNKLSFRSQKISKICEIAEKRRIQQLLNIRKNIQTEQNPFQKIIYKSFLIQSANCDFDYNCKKITLDSEFEKISNQ
jgi:hypothetical protein